MKMTKFDTFEKVSHRDIISPETKAGDPDRYRAIESHLNRESASPVLIPNVSGPLNGTETRYSLSKFFKSSPGPGESMKGLEGSRQRRSPIYINHLLSHGSRYREERRQMGHQYRNRGWNSVFFGLCHG